MVMKAKHAFGSSSDVEAALASGKIDAYDILFLDGDTDNPKVGWVTRNGEIVIVPSGVQNSQVIAVDKLPETGEVGVIYICANTLYIWDDAQFVVVSESTDLSVLMDRLAAVEEQIPAVRELVSALEGRVASVEKRTASLEAKTAELEEAAADLVDEVEAKIDTDEADAKYVAMKYEITGVPEGTLVNYGEKEIRVMVPADAQWTKQSVGAGGDANTYYLTFKTYVYDNNIVGYIEHLGDQVDSEILTDLKTDEYGRMYQPTWLALAKYDEASDTWTYYGANSNEDKYIGWDYQIDWFDADGVMIASDCIRINLSNEECHFVIEPYYMADVTAEVKKYVDEQIEEISEIPVVEF